MAYRFTGLATILLGAIAIAVGSGKDPSEGFRVVAVGLVIAVFGFVLLVGRTSRSRSRRWGA